MLIIGARGPDFKAQEAQVAKKNRGRQIEPRNFKPNRWGLHLQIGINAPLDRPVILGVCEMTLKRHSLSVVPVMLPDQTLYSWATMFHTLAGNVSEDETRLQIFGSSKAGRHFHIPSHLDAFCGRTQLMHGTPEYIVATRTVIPYFT